MGAVEPTSETATLPNDVMAQAAFSGNVSPVLPESIQTTPAAALPASKTSFRAMLSDPDLKGTSWSIFLLCFTAVVREGIECFVFLGMYSLSFPPLLSTGCCRIFPCLLILCTEEL